MELSDSNIKKFLVFWKTETLKSFLYFGKSIFSSQARKLKKVHPEKHFLYSGKMELSNSNIKKLNPKKLLIFQELTFRAWKMKKKHS